MMVQNIFLTIIDDFSRSTWLYLLKNKSKTRKCIESFYNLVVTQFGVKIKILKSDNGAEFLMREFFNTKSIIHHKSCVETPEQNGIVERKHQHLLNVACALLFQSSIPLEYWNDCVLTTTYIINRIPSPLLKNKTPYELLFHCKPAYAHMQIFGSFCFASTLLHGRKKYDPRSRKCVFLGYIFGVKGYKLLDMDTRIVFISRSVLFHENIFHFHSFSSKSTTDSISSPP